MQNMLLMLLLTGALGMVACQSTSEEVVDLSNELVQPPKVLTVGEAALNYLMLPDYMMTDFSSQILPEGMEIVHLDPNRQLLYGAVPKDSGSLWEEIASPDSVEFGEWEPKYQYVKLRNVYLRDSSKWLFRLPFKAFKVDSTYLLEKKFGQATYQLSMAELRDFVSGASVYNGPALFVADSLYGQALVAANHSAPISPGGNPSLTKLVDQLIEEDDSLEEKAQKLLDFVSKEITYQGHGVYEIFMKPHEVLLSGQSDCSGKAVLYSSLLHQAEIPHLLVYLPEHICVAVPGSYAEENEMFFEQDSIRYTFAETTAPGFVIGESILQDPFYEDDIEFLQKPGATNKVFDFKEKDSLEFAVMLVELQM